MNKATNLFFSARGDALTDFARELVTIRSYSGEEGAAARRVKEMMTELRYDEVSIDAVGNVIGRVGGGEKTILFDSHMDTVASGDESEWKYPPFGGEIIGGRLYGRGSVDMKSGLAASVFAAAAARDLNWLEGKTIYVTGTVCEEYCDGVSLARLLELSGIRPDFYVTCEPSDNVITLGHKGKAQTRITTRGEGAHGSAPEKGVNAVYEMAEIIGRAERRNEELARSGPVHGTLVLSDISCVSASLNAVPSECSIYLDRRTVPGETEADIKREMDALVKGKDAAWKIGAIDMKSWTGENLHYEPLHEAWRLDPSHELAQAANRAYEDAFGRPPERYEFWDFSTNAVTPVRMGIPSIGFGPGEYKLAHMTNENCEVEKIKDAYRFYASLMKNL